MPLDAVIPRCPQYPHASSSLPRQIRPARRRTPPPAGARGSDVGVPAASSDQQRARVLASVKVRLAPRFPPLADRRGALSRPGHLSTAEARHRHSETGNGDAAADDAPGQRGEIPADLNPQVRKGRYRSVPPPSRRQPPDRARSRAAGHASRPNISSSAASSARARATPARPTSPDLPPSPRRAHSRFPGAVCTKMDLGEVEPVFGQTGRVVLDITARTAHDGALKWTRAPSTPRAARSILATFPSTCALPSGGRWTVIPKQRSRILRRSAADQMPPRTSRGTYPCRFQESPYYRRSTTCPIRRSPGLFSHPPSPPNSTVVNAASMGRARPRRHGPTGEAQEAWPQDEEGAQPIPYRLEGTEAPHPVRRRRRRATVSDVGPDHRRHAPGTAGGLRPAVVVRDGRSAPLTSIAERALDLATPPAPHRRARALADTGAGADRLRRQATPHAVAAPAGARPNAPAGSTARGGCSSEHGWTR